MLRSKAKLGPRKRKAAEQDAWHPRDGVYASAGADFDDRCMKSGDAVIGLAKSALSIGGASCYVAHQRTGFGYAGFLIRARKTISFIAR